MTKHGRNLNVCKTGLRISLSSKAGEHEGTALIKYLRPRSGEGGLAKCSNGDYAAVTEIHDDNPFLSSSVP